MQPTEDTPKYDEPCPASNACRGVDARGRPTACVPAEHVERASGLAVDARFMGTEMGRCVDAYPLRISPHARSSPCTRASQRPTRIASSRSMRPTNCLGREVRASLRITEMPRKSTARTRMGRFAGAVRISTDARPIRMASPGMNWVHGIRLPCHQTMAKTELRQESGEKMQYTRGRTSGNSCAALWSLHRTS
jgi:hypothetical protein